MPQHSPIEEYLAQRTHGIREKDVDEGHRAWNAGSQAEATGVDQFERAMEDGGGGRAYPCGGGDGDGYAEDDRGVECEYGADGGSPDDVDPYDGG